MQASLRPTRPWLTIPALHLLLSSDKRFWQLLALRVNAKDEISLPWFLSW